jgi:hypothetical protein
MMDSTLAAIRAVVSADPTLTLTDRKRILAALQNAPQQEAPTTPQPDRILKARDAAALIGKTPRTLHRLAAQGAIRRVRFPGRRRGAGYRASDVQALIAGGTAA